MTPFTQLLADLSGTGRVYRVRLSDDWRQGRTAYGGITAALCYEATKRHVGMAGALRSAQFAFIGPATGDFEITVATLRQGKSTVFAAADLVGEGGLAVRSLFCFGALRESQFDLSDLPAPDAPAPEACGAFFQRDAGPAFRVHFDTRIAAGARPVSGADKPDVTLWAKHVDPAASGLVALIALADAPPPAAMGLFTQPAPISTMTWMIDVIDPQPETEDGWWLCRSTGQTVKDGYSAQAMRIWNRAGEPVLVGRQSVAVFA
ncbi:MAG: thioesterase family protein [Pseudomonadota bacterium]